MDLVERNLRDRLILRSQVCSPSQEGLASGPETLPGETNLEPFRDTQAPRGADEAAARREEPLPPGIPAPRAVVL